MKPRAFDLLFACSSDEPPKTQYNSGLVALYTIYPRKRYKQNGEKYNPPEIPDKVFQNLGKGLKALFIHALSPEPCDNTKRGFACAHYDNGIGVYGIFQGDKVFQKCK